MAMDKSDFTPAADLEVTDVKPAPIDCPFMMNHDHSGWRVCAICGFVFPQELLPDGPAAL